jgi:hypothetical protein
MAAVRSRVAQAMALNGRDTPRTAAFGLQVASACIAAGVDPVENQLRIGALHCLLGNAGTAVDAFTRATTADPSIDGYDAVTYQILMGARERSECGRRSTKR